MKKEDGIVVLSLFDGMSCGRIAIDRTGIKVKRYYASEINEESISVSKANYPDIIRLGDITKWKEWDINWSEIDLIFAGSPCQGFSRANNSHSGFEHEESKLFFVFEDILNHVRNNHNPGVKFLLENVVMNSYSKSIISKKMGVPPKFINSSLVSAQNRERLYWFNWGIGKKLEDKHIFLGDILDKNHGQVTKSGSGWEPKLTKTCIHLMSFPSRSYCQGRQYYFQEAKHGTLTLSTSTRKGVVLDKDKFLYRNLSPIECERLQAIPDNYTKSANKLKDRHFMIGNGWTVDVIVYLLENINIPQIHYFT